MSNVPKGDLRARTPHVLGFFASCYFMLDQVCILFNATTEQQWANLYGEFYRLPDMSTPQPFQWSMVQARVW